MQPGAHHVFAAIMDGRDLGDGEAAVGEQHHVGPQGHPTDGLPTDGAEFVLLVLGKLHHSLPDTGAH